MTNRRYTRLTNAISKKIENHSAAVALVYFAYNFIKIHRTLRCTPAMAAGVTNRLWEASDLVALLEASERGLERAAIGYNLTSHEKLSGVSSYESKRCSSVIVAMILPRDS